MPLEAKEAIQAPPARPKEVVNEPKKVAKSYESEKKEADNNPPFLISKVPEARRF